MDALFGEFRKLKRCLLSAHSHRASTRKHTKMNLLFPCGLSANSYTKFAFSLAELTASPRRLVNCALSPGVSFLLGCLKAKPSSTKQRDKHTLFGIINSLVFSCLFCFFLFSPIPLPTMTSPIGESVHLQSTVSNCRAIFNTALQAERPTLLQGG